MTWIPFFTLWVSDCLDLVSSFIHTGFNPASTSQTYQGKCTLQRKLGTVCLQQTLSPFDYNVLSSSHLQYQTPPNTLILKKFRFEFLLMLSNVQGKKWPCKEWLCWLRVSRHNSSLYLLMLSLCLLLILETSKMPARQKLSSCKHPSKNNKKTQQTKKTSTDTHLLFYIGFLGPHILLLETPT